jgi:hypothetical protein
MADLPQIQGHTPDSQNEVNVAIALNKLKFDYVFQYQLGLPGVRGSQVIDFLVYTVPKPTPLFVHGRYWHGTKQQAEDQLKFAEIMSQTHGRWADPIIISEEDSDTVDKAFATLKKVLI